MVGLSILLAMYMIKRARKMRTQHWGDYEMVSMKED